MSNSYFEFKRFTIRQERCAMKVGTDGTLLGAWAEIPAFFLGLGNPRSNLGRPSSLLESPRILDLGTGTGLIALMMAQRYPEAEITAIDIDPEAVAQAQENIAASPFASRITIIQADACDFEAEPFDAIVVNPPYFVDALACPDDQRTTARHAVSLSYAALMASAWRLLQDEGMLSVVIPADCRSQMESEARLRGFFLSRLCWVKTTPKKAPKRCLMEFMKHPVNELITEEGIIELSPGVRSPWYQALTREFYIR